MNASGTGAKCRAAGKHPEENGIWEKEYKRINTGGYKKETALDATASPSVTDIPLLLYYSTI